MPNLSIKSVPEELAESLRQRAARNHRSLQGELMAILEEAVAHQPLHVVQPHSPGLDWRARLETLSGSMAPKSKKDADQIVADIRRTHPEPRNAPSSTEIIRQMRDEHYGEAWVAAGIKDGPWPPAPISEEGTGHKS
jgi:hypothetical protein